jgi:hypothetical protein
MYYRTTDDRDPEAAFRRVVALGSNLALWTLLGATFFLFS